MIQTVLGLNAPESLHYDKFVEDLPDLAGSSVVITGTTSGTVRFFLYYNNLGILGCCCNYQKES